MKVLMVCLGNICRSPLAEGILQHKVDNLKLDWRVASAGTGSWHVGELPDSRSIETAKDNNIDITNQRARQFKQDDFDEFDLIYAMDSSNYQNILRLARNEADRKKVELIMNESEPGKNTNVPDPYWGDFGFQNVFNMLDQATDVIIEKYQ